ncbi:MAG: endonuclease NucS [Dehalococcoidia bacterium]|nr:endonuclease NucS [Dehalococcoidia bacterium]
MDDLFYILTTQMPDCLNRLVESGEFRHLRKGQPESRPFIEDMLTKGPQERPPAKFVLFDRVRGSDTSWRLTAVYDFVDLRVDSEGGLRRGSEAYSLFLRKDQDINPPIPFRQAAPLWEALETTRGRRTTQFYCGGRMLLPIPRDDFETILEWSYREEPPFPAPGVAREPAGTDEDAGIPVAAESELHAYLAENLDRLEPGLEPFDPENYIERPTDDGGRIDLLCRDSEGRVVVVELKKGRADDKVIGQLAWYMGWARERLANGDAVRGLIVAHVISERLRRAARAFEDVRLISYEVEFKLRTVQ